MKNKKHKIEDTTHLMNKNIDFNKVTDKDDFDNDDCDGKLDHSLLIEDLISEESSCQRCIVNFSWIYYITFIIFLPLIVYHYTHNTTYHYDYYVFAQQWPTSLCKSINVTHHGTCSKVPKSVTTWSVHGLWPSRAHTKHYGPFNCNQTWPYDHKNIVPFLSDMEKYWPNLMQNKPDDSFWSHEWTKHGTCACQQGGDGSEGFGCKLEADYFKKALQMRVVAGFDKQMSSTGIVPSLKKAYDFDIIKDTFGNGRYQCYSGSNDIGDDPDVFRIENSFASSSSFLSNGNIVSDYVDDIDNVNDDPLPITHQILAQIMICFDKKFNRVNCEDYEGDNSQTSGDYDTGPYNPRPCQEGVPVVIYPIHMDMGL